MWRFGFLCWRSWTYLRVAAPAALLLWSVHREWGLTTLFWITALFVAGVLLGCRFVLGDLAKRELGTVGRQRVR